MKLLRDRLHTPVLPPRLLGKLGLMPSSYQSWKLSPEQRDMLLGELGLTATPRPEAPRPTPGGRPAMYPHQQDAVDFLRALGWRGALFMEMGTGKTRASIEALDEAGALASAIILSPRSVRWTWVDELRAWKGMEATLVTGTLERRLKLLERPGPWIVNYEGLKIRRCSRCGQGQCACGRKRPTWVYPIVEALLEHDPQALVLDESTRIKDWTTQTARVVHKLAPMIPGPVIPLTGTPMPNQPYDVWSQLKVLERAPLGFTTPRGMMTAFCVMGGYQGREVVSHKNLDKLNEGLGRIAFRKRIDDCIALPERVFSTVHVELEGKEAQAYKSMLKASYAELSRTSVLTADNVLAKLLRLQQITGGIAAPRRNGAKVEALLDLVSDYEMPGIIWCRFTDELEHLAKVLGKAYKVRTFYGQTPDSERRTTIEAFQRGAVDLLIGQPRAGGLGLNLQRSAWMIWYSTSFSSEEREQAVARIYRSGQTKKTRIIDIVAKGTIDEHIAKALERKASVARAALDGWQEWLKS